MKKPERDERGRLLPGSKAALKHGAYGRRMSLTIRRSSSLARAAMIQDLGPVESDLTAAQIILIDKAINLLQITQAIEGWIRMNGAIKKGKLQPVLESYISFVNSLRLCIRDLGVSKRATEKVLSPLELAAKIDAEKEAKEKEVKDVEGWEGRKAREEEAKLEEKGKGDE